VEQVELRALPGERPEAAKQIGVAAEAVADGAECSERRLEAVEGAEPPDATLG